MRYFILKAGTNFRGEFTEFYVPFRCQWAKEDIPTDVIYEIRTQKLLREALECQDSELELLNVEVIEEVPFDVYASSRITIISKEDKDMPVYLYKELLKEIRCKANIVNVGLYDMKPCVY